MDWIIFDDKQYDSALEDNNYTIYQVVPRLIDNPDHEYLDYYAAPARIAQGDYAEFWEHILLNHIRITADPDDLFIPSDV